MKSFPCSSVTFIFFLSSFLWFMTMALFFGGVQLQTFICFPLHEDPNFTILKQFLYNDASFTNFQLSVDKRIQNAESKSSFRQFLRYVYFLRFVRASSLNLLF